MWDGHLALLPLEPEMQGARSDKAWMPGGFLVRLTCSALSCVCVSTAVNSVFSLIIGSGHYQYIDS